MPKAFLPKCILAAAFLAPALHARKLEVGPGKAYAKPSAAAAAAQNGDTVEIAAAAYENDAATWKADNLVIRGKDRYAHLKSNGTHAQGKGIWVISGANTLVENIEFSGAKVPDGNGAGIRQEGPGLTLRRCFFHDNQNGILAGDANGQITIEYTEFAGNGAGDGYTHNLYVNHVKSFTMRYCYSHHAKVGHNIKTRAEKNYIIGNRSLDGADGTASYELDLPNGGLAVIAGNVFQQGAATGNPTILSYGAEGLSNPAGTVQIVNNTFVNDRTQGGTFISLAAATPSARVMNNLFAGTGTLINGKADTSANLQTQTPGFADRAGFDYRLAAGSPAIDKGKDPGLVEGLSLFSVLQFLPPDRTVPRENLGAPDLGAFEYNPGAALGRRGHGKAAVAPAPALWASHVRLFHHPGPVDGLGRAWP